MNFYSQEHDNKVIIRDLETSDPSIAWFMNKQNSFNLVKNNICFKVEGLCIDLTLTNRKYSFKKHISLKLD